MTAQNQSTPRSSSESCNTIPRGADPTNPRIYMQVMIDVDLQLQYQDALDSFFGGRLVDVRNCLRGMEWQGFTSDLSKGDVRISHRCTYAGAGRNVVGVQYDIQGGPFGLIEVIDNLEQSALDLAQFLDLHAPKKELDANPWVVVGNPGQDDQFEIGCYPTMTKGYRNANRNPGSDLMKRLPDGTLTAEF